MKRLWIIIAAAMLTFIAGCISNEEVSRYPSISVSQYGTIDYYVLLSHHDPEVVYNSVCNLAKEARDMGALMSKKDVDKKLNGYIEAKKVYKTMMELAGSKDPRVQAASLRFLQLFISGYGRNAELLALALKVKPRSYQARYEKAELLLRAASKEADLDTGMIRTLVSDRSWLISRAAYALVNKLENEALRMEIIRRYKRSNTEFEKLLMLEALKNNYSDKVFKFLSEELMASDSLQVRRAIIIILPYAKNADSVVSWLESNYRKLPGGDMKHLVLTNINHMGSGFSTRLFITLFGKDFIPKENFYGQLYADLKEYQEKKEKTRKDEEIIRNLKKLEETIQANSSLNEAWSAFKARKEAKKGKKAVDPKMREEYNQAVDRFKADSAAVLSKYNIDEETRSSFMEGADEGLKQYLFETLEKE